MKEETFTDFVINRLQIADVPLIVQEIVVKDLGELIIKRAFIEIMSTLNEEDSDRLTIYIESNDFDGVYGFLTANDTYEKTFTLISQEVVEDFVKQLHS